jgi:hypothetical protein
MQNAGAAVRLRVDIGIREKSSWRKSVEVREPRNRAIRVCKSRRQVR